MNRLRELIQNQELLEFRRGGLQERWETFLQRVDSYLSAPTPEGRDALLIELGALQELRRHMLLPVSEDFFDAALAALLGR